MAHQQVFEAEVNKAINLVGDFLFIQSSWFFTMAFQSTWLANVGINFMFVIVGQNMTKDVSLGKVWSTLGL